MLLNSELLNTVRKRIDESKQIPNYSDYVILPNEGLVYSLKRNKFIGAKNSKKGYWQCSLTSDDGKEWRTGVHRVVYTACYGDIPEGLEVNHIDENKSNNIKSNLNLLTPKENNNWGTHNERISKANTNNPKRSKAVGAFKDGKLVMVFPSTQEAQRNGYKSSHICKCCSGVRQSHKGYEWRFIEKESV